MSREPTLTPGIKNECGTRISLTNIPIELKRELIKASKHKCMSLREFMMYCCKKELYGISKD